MVSTRRVAILPVEMDRVYVASERVNALGEIFLDRILNLRF